MITRTRLKPSGESRILDSNLSAVYAYQRGASWDYACWPFRAEHFNAIPRDVKDIERFLARRFSEVTVYVQPCPT